MNDDDDDDDDADDADTLNSVKLREIQNKLLKLPSCPLLSSRA